MQRGMLSARIFLKHLLDHLLATDAAAGLTDEAPPIQDIGDPLPSFRCEPDIDDVLLQFRAMEDLHIVP